MPKINQEEYEVLKGLLNVGYGWLARDSERSALFSNDLWAYKETPYKEVNNWDNGDVEHEKMNNDHFNFIQWEDEEPYEISKLIEGYKTIEFIESEETEVKNKEEVKSWFENDKLYAGEYVKHKIDQLDEPEILTPEWIEGNKIVVKDVWDGRVHVAVPTKELQNLLLPKQPFGNAEQLDERERLETAYKDILDRGEFEFDGKKYKVVEKENVLSQEWIEEYQGEVLDEDEGIRFNAVPTDDLQILIVPKQEKVDQAYKAGYEKGKEHTFYKGYLEGLADKENEPETVADVISDFWKSFERLKEVLGTEVEELEE